MRRQTSKRKKKEKSATTDKKKDGGKTKKVYASFILHFREMQESCVTSKTYLEQTVYMEAAAATGKLKLYYSQLYILLQRVSDSSLCML